MNNAPTAAQLAAAGWSKSSYSAADNECVEVAHARLYVGVRDSKDLSGPSLLVPMKAFTTLIDAVRTRAL